MIAGAISDLCVRPGPFALPVSFVLTLPSLLIPRSPPMSLSLSLDLPFSAIDRTRPLSLYFSPSATSRVRACVWVRASAVELVNGRTRTRSPLLASAARSSSVRALRKHCQVLVLKSIERLRGTRLLRQKEKKIDKIRGRGEEERISFKERKKKKERKSDRGRRERERGRGGEGKRVDKEGK